MKMIQKLWTSLERIDQYFVQWHLYPRTVKLQQQIDSLLPPVAVAIVGFHWQLNVWMTKEAVCDIKKEDGSNCSIKIITFKLGGGCELY